MKCPACKTPDLLMTERRSIEIDYCPQCRGVWLDRGELDKIIEKSASQLAPAAPAAPANQGGAWPAQPPHHGHHGHGYKPYKRRKSFLEELFD